MTYNSIQTSRNKQTAHLAWCALIALHLVRQEGVVQSELQENIFICRWLAEARRTRRFHRETAPDLEWLLREGRTLGVQAQLPDKLEYLWKTINGKPEEQPALSQLIQILNTARRSGWNYYVLSPGQWQEWRRSPLSPDINAIFVSKALLESAFDDAGNQLSPVPVRLTGKTDDFRSLLAAHQWKAIFDGAKSYNLVSDCMS